MSEKMLTALEASWENGLINFNENMRQVEETRNEKTDQIRQEKIDYERDQSYRSKS